MSDLRTVRLSDSGKITGIAAPGEGGQRAPQWTGGPTSGGWGWGPGWRSVENCPNFRQLVGPSLWGGFAIAKFVGEIRAPRGAAGGPEPDGAVAASAAMAAWERRDPESIRRLGES